MALSGAREHDARWRDDHTLAHRLIDHPGPVGQLPVTTPSADRHA